MISDFGFRIANFGKEIIPGRRRRQPLRVILLVLLLAAASVLEAEPESLRDDIQMRRLVSAGCDVRRIDRDPTTGDLYVLCSNGTIRRVVFEVDGVRMESVYESSDTQVGAPLGFAFGPDGALYVVGNVPVGASTRGGVSRGVRNDPGGEAREWTTIVLTEAYPRSNSSYDHNMNGIVVSPDNRHLYINSGSRTDHGEEQANGGNFPGVREAPLNAVILRVPTTVAERLDLPNDEAALKAGGYLYADGVRNSFDLAFAPNGDFFATENSGVRDDNDELNWIRAGHHYGFPWRMGTNDTPMQFPGYDPESDLLVNHNSGIWRDGLVYNDPDYPPPPEGVTFSDPVINHGPDGDSYRDPRTGEIHDASDRGETLSTFTAHRSPLGLVFDVEGALGGEYTGDGFVLCWTAGDPDGEPLSGPFKDPSQDLLHLELTKTAGGDNYEMTATRIAGGFSNPIDAVLTGNVLYVLERSGGGIWEVTFPARRSVTFIRGDSNGDERIDLTDGVFVVEWLFSRGATPPCIDAADTNDSGTFDLSDAVSVFLYLFDGRMELPPPGPFCGVDPTEDELGCEDPAGCL